MRPSEDPTAVVEAAATVLRATARPMSPAQRQAGWQALSFRLGMRRRARPVRLWLLLGALGATSATALVLTQAGRDHAAPEPRALAYTVEGGAVDDGGYIRAFAATGARLRFAEGTELHLRPGARGRLGRIDGHGARFAIEQGEAEVKVTPLPNARWLVDAGPFLIAVRGTTFTASWDGATERLDVDMSKGLVSVTGPVADGEVAVRAGQHLTVNVARKEVVLRPVESRPPAATAPSDAPAVADRTARPRVEPVHRAASSLPRARTAEVRRSWVAALAAGDLDGILRDAEARGVATALAEASASELAALADAARYRRRDELARQVLLAERARFPASERAHDAAFLLGRLDDLGARGRVQAIEWYDRYLNEVPRGAYAAEALGRKMVATENTRGRAAARAIAQEYLRRFPTGTYASTARAYDAGS